MKVTLRRTVAALAIGAAVLSPATTFARMRPTEITFWSWVPGIDAGDAFNASQDGDPRQLRQ